MWKLVIEDDEGKRTVVPLTRDQYSIGRKEGNTIRLTERNVSREHARLLKRMNGGAAPRRGVDAGAPTERSRDAANVKDGGHGERTEPSTFVLEDLTSYNGVFVNGLRIAHAQSLSHGDLVQIGDYRIILQDESLADISEISNDSKQTLPDPQNVRAATLLDRPNRLVMLAGPSPGAEFPLDRDRMTVGRAEDATISVNHNSVSRLHCEVHALGDGRFEIVDKGSSNGVRVNGAELRRGIVEQGDVIELGDVQFKFVGAGQIFRQTESGQLSLLGDREPHSGRERRGNGLPLTIFAAVVLVGAAAAWIWARPHSEPPRESLTRALRDEATLMDAKKLCAAGECDAAHESLSALSETSPLRSSQAFRDLENEWADGVLARADSETDWAKKRALYQRVAQAVTVSGTRRKTAADKLEQSDLIANAPVSGAPASSAPAKGDTEDTAVPHLAAARRAAVPADGTLGDTASPAALQAQTSANGGGGANPKATAPTVDDRERQLALQGTPDAKLQLKQQLEQRVGGGRANDTEIRLLISTCKDLGDRVCVQQARAALKQRQ
jgi:pSer/pThr/pTyr-binding forkhead associated (FHA) protein